MDQIQRRVETLERTAKRQTLGLYILGGLLAFTLLAGARVDTPYAPMTVTIDKPIKIIIEDIGVRVRQSHPLPVQMK